MNRYSFLAEKISEALGVNYDIQYFENEEKSWNDILVDNMIHGVLVLDNSTSQKTGDLVVTTDYISMPLMIPLDIMDSSIKEIYTNMLSFMGEELQNDTELVICSDYKQSDKKKDTINGADYAFIVCSFVVVSYTAPVMGNDGYVKIEGTTLAGVFNIVYGCNKQLDGTVVIGSLIQKNRVAGIGKSLTVDLILCRDNATHELLMGYADGDTEFEVKYFNGFITRTMTMIVGNWTEYVTLGNVIKAQAVFNIR